MNACQIKDVPAPVQTLQEVITAHAQQDMNMMKI